jgi:hypothetical protein
MPLPPLTSFGPEILATLLKGSREEVVLDMPYNEAVELRKRMHFLRARMRQDKHELASIVAGAKVTIRWGPEVATSTSRKGVKYPTDSHSLVQLVVRPQDYTFRAAIEAAGVKIDIPEPIPAIVPSIDESEDILTEFLRDKTNDR